ncbi:MAG: type II methionyl aminopeptidase [Nanoarchaeota archaeon]|nr:type II methionyl aminopeptidase [Nanoarchaeota archaeon]MCG2718221.1 type II methionyl aminopeptidase [Nanoarchaeota archaeon]
MDDWEKAGKIAAEALEFGKNLIKVDASLLEVADKIEAKIVELGGKPAFPVNLSINQIAAHYAPLPGDESRFKEGDLVKIDVGAHVNGAIGDTALTVDLGDNKELVKASEEALKAAIEIFTPGTKLGDVGKAIQDKIKEFGFVPIVNLSGHGLALYKIHSGVTVPNYDNGDETELQEGQILAIEPFATPGEGKIIEGKPSGIYELRQHKPVRDMNSRKILKFIAEEYKTLPFAKRWLVKKFPTAGFALRILEQQGILMHYSHLSEKTKALVSQAEHTVKVADKPIVLTKI